MSVSFKYKSINQVKYRLNNYKVNKCPYSIKPNRCLCEYIKLNIICLEEHLGWSLQCVKKRTF